MVFLSAVLCHFDEIIIVKALAGQFSGLFQSSIAHFRPSRNDELIKSTTFRPCFSMRG